MQVFTVRIKEELVCNIMVEASSKDEALEQVRQFYRNGEVVLDYDDFQDVDFCVVDQRKGRVIKRMESE